MSNVLAGPARSSGLFIGAVFAVLFAQLVTGALASPAAATIACAAMLLLGLPHGTLDLKLIAQQRGSGVKAGAVLFLYLTLAGATYLIWQADPILALTAFLLIAVVHFAEDWSATGSTLLAHAIALATLAAPSLLWRDEMRWLFVTVAGDPAAAVLGDVVFLIAPVGLLVAAVGIVALWRDGHRRLAAEGVVVLGGMILLPPAVGFALFFCLFHSPRHLRDALATLNLRRFAEWRLVVGSLTLAALGMAAAILLSETRGAFAAGVVASSFMTLAILTVPHMLVPVIVQALSAARRTPASPQAMLPA